MGEGKSSPWPHCSLARWHVDAIAHQLMRVRSGESRRLLINQPPRSLKSICVSVAYVAWLLGHDPTRHVIVASYSGDFAAELHRQFRMVIASEWYAAVFPNLHLAKETGLELVTSQGGSRYATSVGGTLTGRGADLIIVDDPLNANEIHSETARKRVIAEADETSIQPSWAWKMAGGHVCVWLGRVLSDQSIKLDQFALGRAIGIILACEMPRGRLGDKAP
jgi:hypothetical protein